MYYLVHKMNNLFGKGKEKILKYFYNHKLRESYFSEILKETELTPNTTLKHLETLQELQIITSKKKTANTFYKLNISNLAIYSLLSYFDFERFNQLSATRKKAILNFLDQLQVKPLIVLLFGSTAKGTHTKESDVDLLLVYNKKELNNNKLKENIEAVTGVMIQTIILELEYFEEQLLKEDDKVIAHAIKTGYPIQGFELFYKRLLQ